MSGRRVVDAVLMAVLLLCIAWVVVVWLAVMIVAVPVLVPLSYLVDFLSPGPEVMEEGAQ